MSLDDDLMETDCLDRFGYLHLAPGELDTGETSDPLHDVGHADRTVELALVPGLGGEHHTAADELGGDRLGGLLGPALRLETGFAYRLGLGQGPVVGDDRLAPWKQEVACVSVGDVDDVATSSQILDIGGEDEPHRPPR